MKKILTLLGAVATLAGCNSIGGESSTESSSAPMSSETMISSELAAESSAVVASESIMSNAEEAITSSNATNELTSDMEISLVPQKMELDQNLTLENDSVLQEIETRMKQAEELGIENDVAIHFTGMYLGEEGSMQAIFIIVNRMDVAMTNINITVSFSTIDGATILEEAPFYLTEESFGVLEPDTAMPMYLKIQPENEEAFFSTSNMEELIYKIDEFDFEER
ncbi:lipoprotein [Carnobacterium pleistocenium]|uniref:lipoprotein n=1 Tax=Carnobacterium pleistocenium TaxID=181073 RepID=UPI0005520F02|nr:lipoprotein [Carnobacterium pleistocenium]